ncbi:lactoylglutathione lyase [Commensalibacter oyaizuii]|uniref:lactoylglutathione lyase n=1 Tax=Commensalibacter oyaizuii TaxID=3043873 RepID=A0ABT6Q211_9PROT|nr:lactoylglutathione lyase [Commensalibacter sp. TBRC 16381]MDI2091161.1 lactoylglutathione lyase [Commensalibacter sp. TBRC 16381]
MFNTEKQDGVVENPDTETQGYVFNHTMLRVKDPKRSLAFYTGVLGMRLLRRLDFAEMKFSLYFLVKTADENIPEDTKERQIYAFSREGVLEFTHNWGTENDDTQYHSGNSEPKGFGHLCFSVPDIRKACARFEKLGVEFQKKLDSGSMKDIAFIKDPDGYWIEIVQADLNGDMGR